MIKIYVDYNMDKIIIHNTLTKDTTKFTFGELCRKPHEFLGELINTIASHPKPGDNLEVELRTINEDVDEQIEEW